MWKYILFLLAVHTVGRLPLRAGYALAEVIGRVSYWLVAGARRNVLGNLRHAMGPEAGEGEVRTAAKRVFVNVVKYYVDLFRMPYMDLDDFYSKRFHYYGFDEYLLPAAASGKGVVMLSAHLGNPELAIQGMMPRGVKAFALTEPLQPERLHRLVDSLRASKGHEFAPVGFAGVKRVIQVLREGGVVALMGDRDIEGPKALLPFFGDETLMPTGPIEVALRTGATLIPSFCYRTGNDGLEAHLLEPLEMERTGETERDVRTNALRFLALMEEHIRQHPDQWVVLESIWDGKPVESERQPAGVGEQA